MPKTDKAKVQLFMVPFAGESGTAFKRLCGLLPDWIDAVPLVYAGHGHRVREPFFTVYSAFLQDSAAQIRDRRNPEIPMAVLGYSLGASIAFDLVTRQLIDQPVHFFACARAAVNVRTENQRYYALDDTEFRQCVIRLGGINPRIKENQRFWDLYLPMLRADYGILGQFQYSGGILPCGLTVMYSEKDTPRSLISGWRGLTKKNCAFYEMGDSHFFILEHYPAMAERIRLELSER